MRKTENTATTVSSVANEIDTAMNNAVASTGTIFATCASTSFMHTTQEDATTLNHVSGVARLSFLLVFALSFFIFTDFKANAAIPYTVELRLLIAYIPCVNGNMMRVESWVNENSSVVYQHVTDCNGKVSESGRKPLRSGNGNGGVYAGNPNPNFPLDGLSGGTAVAMMSFSLPPSSNGNNHTIPTINVGNTTIYPVDVTNVSQNEFHYRFVLPIDAVYEVANTSISQTNTSVTIKTNLPVQAKLVNLNTGAVLVNFVNVGSNASYTFNTNNLQSGCSYGIVVQQHISEANKTFVITTHNFCK